MEVWLSRKVEYVLLRVIGIWSPLLIITSIKSPSFFTSGSVLLFLISVPKEKGVTSNKEKFLLLSLWGCKIFSASRVAPYAIASSGLIESFILLFGK